MLPIQPVQPSLHLWCNYIRSVASYVLWKETLTDGHNWTLLRGPVHIWHGKSCWWYKFLQGGLCPRISRYTQRGRRKVYAYWEGAIKRLHHTWPWFCKMTQKYVFFPIRTILMVLRPETHYNMAIYNFSKRTSIHETKSFADTGNPNIQVIRSFLREPTL